jgi:murein DD-endopeptidase MepM/ murein hydrolase activator NlpD
MTAKLLTIKKLILLFGLFSLTFAATLNITPPDPVQGNSFKVVLRTDAAVQEARVIFNKTAVPLYLHSPHKYLAILGTAYNWPAGAYPLTVTYRQNGATVTKSASVTLRAGKFDIDTLIISDEKQNEGATDFAALAEENKILGAAFRAQKKGSYMDGVLVSPLGRVTASITSPYGAQRYYKNKAGQQISEWSHRGVDYGVRRGTPVYAAQNGVISVAASMQVHGGTIVIDHGQGVMSIYNHLDELLVQKNQYVTKNALIAYSGNTGLTTGPHLHYGLSVHDVRVNPQEWFIRKWY